MVGGERDRVSAISPGQTVGDDRIDQAHCAVVINAPGTVDSPVFRYRAVGYIYCDTRRIENTAALAGCRVARHRAVLDGQGVVHIGHTAALVRRRVSRYRTGPYRHFAGIGETAPGAVISHCRVPRYSAARYRQMAGAGGGIVVHRPAVVGRITRQDAVLNCRGSAAVIADCTAHPAFAGRIA